MIRKHFFQKIAVVTGTNGMGFETCLMLARNGFDTFATMRKLHGTGGIKEDIRHCKK